MATAYAQINPGNLTWARERARLSTDMLAKKLHVAEEKVVAWESGQKRPTFKQAKVAAEKMYIPFGYLFLNKPPKEKLLIPDLRTLDGESIGQPSAELSRMVEIIVARQRWYQDYLFEQGIYENTVVGRFNVDHDPDYIVADMRKVLGFGPHPTRGKWEDYQRELVKNIEKVGVLVMRQGDLGHSTKPLSVEEFRGFAIFDKVSPVIFINNADTPSARLFTLIHELAHIWIGESGISDARPQAHRKEEILCNAVAAEFLVPANEFQNLWRECESWIDNLPGMEAHFHVSTWVLARRALSLSLITQSQYSAYIAYVKKQYDSRDKGGGGPSYYRTKRSQLSESFSRALIAEALSGKVLLRDAGELLGMKPNNITKLAKELDI
jgi:Zn-dependent peptidase ImmA (M78 family)/DNA-binding XRE family transcriptional regulator